MQMDKYRKGKNVEEAVNKESIPIPKLPENFLWMHVHGGTKIHNVLEYAFDNFEKYRHVVWSGSGPAVKKTVTCAEIMKREYKQTLYQITKICFRISEEYWEPIIEHLDQLVVKRRVPMIHILLSLDSLDQNELGYQCPGEIIPFKKEIAASHQRCAATTNRQPGTSESFTSNMSGGKKRHKHKPPNQK